MNAARLLEYFDRIAEAPDAVSRLRKFILDLAVRGKLVEQDPNDECPRRLLKQLEREKQNSSVLAVRKSLSLDAENEGDIWDIPNSWQFIQLGKLPSVAGIFIDGDWVESKDQDINGDVRLVQLADVGSGEYRDRSARFLNDQTALRLNCTFLEENDVLIARMPDPIGRACLFPGDTKKSVTVVDVAILRPEIPGASLKYLVYAINSSRFNQNVLKYTAGTTRNRISRGNLAKLPLPFPPLSEQHRIVAKVDELMALCDRLEASQAKRESRRDRLASASLKRIGQPEDMGNGDEFRENVRFHLHHLPRLATRPEHVKELRQTILNLAVRGKLVPQDPNDEPVSELLSIVSVERARLLRTKKVRNIKYDDVVREGDQPFPLPVGWAWVRFGDLILDSDSGWSPQTESFPRSGDAWGVLKVSAVSWDEFKPEQNKQLFSGVVPPDSAKVNEGDFLISRANTSELVAKCVIVCTCPDKLIMSDKIVRLYIARECNKYYLRSVNNYADYARTFYSQKSSGTSLSMQNVTRQQIYSLPIPLPPIAEQHRIVAKVDELMNLCDKLEVHLATTQTNQSRLLEATLCDALGVTCLPVSRPSRPAPSQKRVAAAHSEQPPRPIAPHPAPVQTPTAAVQGSLVDQPTPQVEKPRAANGDVPVAILAQMQPGQEYSRAQLVEALGLSVYEWNMAIRELKESGRVVQTGERRGARYQLKNVE